MCKLVDSSGHVLRTAHCPTCQQERKATRWVKGQCQGCYWRRRKRPQCMPEPTPCDVCQDARYDLIDGVCPTCAADTDESLDALIAQQVKCAPLTFWREVLQRDQPYDVPEWALQKLRGNRCRPRLPCTVCGEVRPTESRKTPMCDTCRSAKRAERQRQRRKAAGVRGVRALPGLRHVYNQRQMAGKAGG